MRGRAHHFRGNPKHLFDCWPQVAERVRLTPLVALFVDFDGTLARLRKRPESVGISDRTRDVLRRLVDNPSVRVFILSGRRRADVKKRVGLPGVRYFGLHGSEGPRREMPQLPRHKSLQLVRRQLVNGLTGLRGVWIEDKGTILAIHFRGAAASVGRRADVEVRRVVAQFKPELRIMPGNKVWEIVPRELPGKGAAVRALLLEMPPAALPIYIGDDATDESAFAVLRRGVTVRVGRRPTKARFSLTGPQEVRQFLQRLNGALGETPR
jgi:trehalose-phosphatase